MSPAAGQTTNPSRPSKEYVRLGGRVIAVENGCRIGGQALNGSTAMSDVTISLTGTHTDTAKTDTSGNYLFVNLQCGGNYTVSASKAGYTFSPSSKNYAPLSQDQPATNFNASTVTYSITGRVTLSGAGISGVTVTLSGSQPGSTTTDSGGNYSFSGLSAGGNYTVTPSQSGYKFSPTDRAYGSLSANQTGADFAVVTYTVSGRTTVAGTGASLPNVTVTLTGSQSRSTQTDANGNYSFPGLPAGGNYTLTPSLATYNFNPGFLDCPNLSADRTANFEGTKDAYTISGRVTEGAYGVSGATMTLTGPVNRTMLTDANGYYAFSGLPAGGPYYLSASKTNFTFSPTSTTFNNLSANQTANFTGNQYPIAVYVNPSSGSSRRQTLTFAFRDADGYSDLQWTQVEINGTLGGSSGCVLYYQLNDPSHVYLGDNTYNPQWRQATPGYGSAVTTSQGMCRLYPASSSLTLSGTDATLSMDLEFLPAFSGSKGVWMVEKDYSHASNTNWVQMGSWTVPAQIGGQVTMGSSGLSGVTMTVSGCSSGSTVTDAYGYYSLDVWPGGTCTVTPSKQYYMFAPGSTQVPGSGAQTANFAVKATASIVNTSRPGHNTDLKVGDNWTITINGPPNQTVAVTMAKNGGSPSSSVQGETNAAGAWSMSGYMPADVVGNWTEAWTVGPVQAIPTLVFTVSP